MTIPRPQEYVLAVFLILATIGPAIAGLLCHLVVAGFGLAWGLFV